MTERSEDLLKFHEIVFDGTVSRSDYEIYFEQHKDRLLSQLYTTTNNEYGTAGVPDERILDAFRTIPRHRFAFALQEKIPRMDAGFLYTNTVIDQDGHSDEQFLRWARVQRGDMGLELSDLGKGEYYELKHEFSLRPSSTLSKPRLVSRMLHLTVGRCVGEEQEDPTIVELGSGLGYVLSLIAASRPNAKVMGTDIDPLLTETARDLLPKLDALRNRPGGEIEVVDGGAEELVDNLDEISACVISFAVPEGDPLIEKVKDRLKIGGRLIYPSSLEGSSQRLMLVEKANNNFLSENTVGTVRFVPMKTFG